MQPVAVATGLELRVVESVAAGLECSMRRMDEREVLVSLGIVLQRCVKNYCGGGNANAEQFGESVDFVMSQFGHLGIDEVSEAFRLAAAGKFEADLTGYYGQFPIASLGKLLVGYDDYRKRAVQALRRAESDANYQNQYHLARVWWQSEAGKRAQDEFQSRRVVTLRMMERPTVDDVTAYDYMILVERGHVALSLAEKNALMEDAVPLLKLELMAQQQGRGLGERIEAAKALDGLRDSTEKQKVLAQRLAVVRWIEQQQASAP